jgi:nitrate/TMAO reductase-like tetraheme cytochrome c subunit
LRGLDCGLAAWLAAGWFLTGGLRQLAAGAEARTPAPPASSARASSTIGGVARDQAGPVQGAVVRVPGASSMAVTEAEGNFTLECASPTQLVDLSVWAPGYFVAGTNRVAPGRTNVVIELAAHPRQDNPDYAWISAFASQKQPLNCQQCMTAGRPGGTLPFDEWRRDAHSQSASNPRFLSMYNGTDLRGRKSPPTRYTFHRDYGLIPQRPDTSGPYFGPGFKLDFPHSAGNCAACHVSVAAAGAPYETDPNSAAGVAAEGVTCDFCHKITDVHLEDKTGLPHPNMPGVLSYDFLRPGPKQQVFVGPYDDAPGNSVYSPLQNRSEFCAPCHFGAFWNINVYNSFGEWLASPYADPQRGKTCQDCHMPHTGATRIASPAAGSERVAYPRDPLTIFSHAMPGASDTHLLRNAVTLQTTSRREGDKVVVEVTITNDKTGHHVPTDSPLRQLILVVLATTTEGRPLSLLAGPTIPAWAGIGDPAKGNYAKLPGKAFAKVLEELWTEVSPTAAYWNQTRLVSDNRLAALATDASHYVFAAPEKARVLVKVTLLFRRAFKGLMEQKGWDVPDIVMAEESFVLK